MRERDIHSRAIGLAGLAIALTVGSVVTAVFLLLRHWELPPGADRVRLPYDLVIEGAALQSAPQPDLAHYRAEKQKLLESSAWVDAHAGIARIPIADAMDLLARAAAAPASAAKEQP